MDFQRALGVLQQFAVVADQQQAAAVPAPRAHAREQEGAVGAVEVVAGFVQHEQVGVAAERADQRQQRALAARQRSRRQAGRKAGFVQHRLPA